MTPSDAAGAHRTYLSPALTDDFRSSMADAGWTFDGPDGYSACGSTRRSTYYAKPYVGTALWSHGDPLVVWAHATLRKNVWDDDAREFTCTPTEGPGYGGGNVMDLDTQSTITIDELIEGVRVRTEDPATRAFVELQMRARG